MTERYLIPASLGSAFLIPYLLNQQYLLRKSFSSILILLFLLQFGVNSYRMGKTANIFAKEGASTDNFLGTIIAKTDSQSSILIVANPVNDYEWSLSINRYLNHYDRRNTYFHFTESKNQGNKFNDNLEKRIKTKFEGRISTDISHISCIAIFPQNEQAFTEKHPSTTDFSKFTRNDFDGFVLYLKKN